MLEELAIGAAFAVRAKCAGLLVDSDGRAVARCLHMFDRPSYPSLGSLTKVNVISLLYTFTSAEFGPFSAVSTPIFASKYSFFSIFRDLQDVHSFAPLGS